MSVVCARVRCVVVVSSIDVKVRGIFSSNISVVHVLCSVFLLSVEELQRSRVVQCKPCPCQVLRGLPKRKITDRNSSFLLCFCFCSLRPTCPVWASASLGTHGLLVNAAVGDTVIVCSLFDGRQVYRCRGITTRDRSKGLLVVTQSATPYL